MCRRRFLTIVIFLLALFGLGLNGCRSCQAIDFTNQGVWLDDPEARFELEPEYEWLQNNAARFSFFLSYPEDSPSGIGFEPWHWHYQNAQ